MHQHIEFEKDLGVITSFEDQIYKKVNVAKNVERSDKVSHL